MHFVRLDDNLSYMFGVVYISRVLLTLKKMDDKISNTSMLIMRQIYFAWIRYVIAFVLKVSKYQCLWSNNLLETEQNYQCE